MYIICGYICNIRYPSFKNINPLTPLSLSNTVHCFSFSYNYIFTLLCASTFCDFYLRTQVLSIIDNLIGKAGQEACLLENM